MATLKHINSKNADYGAAEQYLLFEHDEFTMKPVLDENGRLIPREDYRLSTLNCGGEDFAVACMRSNLRYEKNQRREDVKSHHYIISFDPRDGPDNGLTVDRAQALGEQFCKEHFPGHQALVCTHPDGHNHSGNIHVHIVINSLRIEEVPFLPYMDRPADTKAGCKHRCTDAALYLYGGRKLMTSEIKDILENMTTAAPEMEDYIGEDGLLYCGKCHTPKEAYFPEGKELFGRDRHPAECDCQRAAREQRQAAEEHRRHVEAVENLKQRAFADSAMQQWTFENDNGRNPQTGIARRYAEHWEEMQAENIGCLFWGNVGNGKSYLAGCIANALMEKEVPVYMTNFAVILGDLSPGFTGRNEYISRLCRYPLLIIDDFGMERGTDYGLEQVFHVIDTRYRSNKPLIATTNRPLDELKKPTDTAHSRIYDRLLSMCVPIRFTGVNFRQETAKRKMETMKKLLAE